MLAPMESRTVPRASMPWGGNASMMFLIFAVLLAAFVLGWLGRETLAICVLILCLVIAASLFLWEVYSPKYGFAMPWISVERALPATLTGED